MSYNKLKYFEFLDQIECFVYDTMQDTILCYGSNDNSTEFYVPELKKNGIFHLWRWSLNNRLGLVPSLISLLSHEERIKARRFNFDELKSKYIISHGILRLILSKYLKLYPEDIDFQVETYGKPHIAEGLNTNEIRFNLSHSDNYAVCAVILKNDIGVDIEENHHFNSQEELTRLSKYVLQPNELLDYSKIREENRCDIFLKIWTIKEACCKAIGTGLQTLNEPCINFSIEEESISVGWIETAEKFLRFINFHFKEKIFVSIVFEANPYFHPYINSHNMFSQN